MTAPRMLSALALPLALVWAAPAWAQEGQSDPYEVLQAAPPGDHFLEAVMPNGETILYSIHIPEAVARGERVPLILGLHYSAMNAPHIGGAYLHSLVIPALASTGAILVAPDARPVAGAEYRLENWTTERNQEAVLWLLRSLFATYPIDQSKVAITGYSGGGRAVWYMADKHRELFSAGIAVSAPAPYQVVESVGIPMYVIHSVDDESTGAILVQGGVEQLQEKGADIQIRIIRGPQHWQTEGFVPTLASTIPWLQEVWSGKHKAP